MTKDRVLELAGLGEGYTEPHYPGSKRPRRSAAPVAPAKDPEGWDARPVYFNTKDGERREFFTCGALAKALGRDLRTMHKWIERGIMPEAAYRGPRRRKTLGSEGQRLYTRAQIEAVIKAATAEGTIIGVARPVITEQFKSALHQIISRRHA